MVGNGGNIHFDSPFIYPGKAQGIWNMFTYGGRNVPSRLRNATQSTRNKSTIEIH